MRVICCDPPGEILPIVNTLDPRITVEEDEEEDEDGEWEERFEGAGRGGSTLVFVL
jgi:hypothetical protein